jgi:hypothetical protein
MIRKKPTKQSKISAPRPGRKRKLLWLSVIAIVAPLLWVALLMFASFRQTWMSWTSHDAHKISSQSNQAMPTQRLSEKELTETAWDPAWPSLPDSGTPAQPIEQVRAMYAFAARHSEVVEYAPCYCGCEGGGHKNVHDCFVKGYDASGKPQWDEMGFT